MTTNSATLTLPFPLHIKGEEIPNCFLSPRPLFQGSFPHSLDRIVFALGLYEPITFVGQSAATGMVAARFPNLANLIT